MKNIVYQTDQLARYFTQHRIAWHQFYASERAVIERLQLERHHEILDIGCGCGGLGLALRDQFGIERYTGVEINASAAEAGRLLNPRATILCGDILDLSTDALHRKRFDVVFSLSCVDYNIRFSNMLAVAWSHVLPGGHLVSTFRLTLDDGCNDIDQSFQYINADGGLHGERACYVVLNAKALAQYLISFSPAEVNASGYWGTPSATAVTPYERLCFAAFSVRKRNAADSGPLRADLDLPTEILETLGLPSQ